MARRKKKDLEKSQANQIATDPSQIEDNAGAMGRAFIRALDRAVRLQSGVIRAYVDWLRRSNPDASPAEIQKIMDRHFLTAASGTGAGAGGAAAVPGVGLVTGTAAIAGESLLFVDMAAVYTVGSAYLRGVDISDAEHRRAIVLMVLLGTQGAAIVDTLVGPDAKGASPAKTLARFSGPTLNQANSMMQRALYKTSKRRLRRMWIGKLLPMGIGVVAGTAANRALAKKVIENTGANLDPIPAEFAAPLPPKSAEEQELEDAVQTKAGRVAAVMKVFKRNRADEADTTTGGGDSDL